MIAEVEGDEFKRITQPLDDIEIIQLEVEDGEIVKWDRPTSEKDSFYF